MSETIERKCIFCGAFVPKWIPFSGLVSEFVERTQVIGSDPTRFGCPSCGSFDRERHLLLYMRQFGLLYPDRDATILHIAPEPILTPFIRNSITPKSYVMGDLNPATSDVERMDVQAIPWPDRSCTMAICNHVLEHVDNPNSALHELYRILKVGGRLICQTPYSLFLANTFCDPAIETREDRNFFYAQEDHIRLFGKDIERLILSAGFSGRLVHHAELLPHVDGEAYGININEPFFDFRKIE